MINCKFGIRLCTAHFEPLDSLSTHKIYDFFRNPNSNFRSVKLRSEVCAPCIFSVSWNPLNHTESEFIALSDKRGHCSFWPHNNDADNWCPFSSAVAKNVRCPCNYSFSGFAPKWVLQQLNKFRWPTAKPPQMLVHIEWFHVADHWGRATKKTERQKSLPHQIVIVVSWSAQKAALSRPYLRNSILLITFILFIVSDGIYAPSFQAFMHWLRVVFAMNRNIILLVMAIDVYSRLKTLTQKKLQSAIT